LLDFFKVTDPLRIIAVAFFMAILSGMYLFILEVPITQPEYLWMLLAENLAEGKRIHVDLIDDSGPFAAGVYWLVFQIFGKSFFAFKFLSALIILFQAYYINYLFYKYKSFEENSLIPAIVVVFLFNFSFDLLNFSPTLMGSTFVILSLGQILSNTNIHKDNFESSLMIGVYGGIAACFHFPFIVFFPFIFFAGIIITGYSFHQFLITLMGYLIPIVISALYYFWMDSLPVFFMDYVFASRMMESYKHVYVWDLVILSILPLTFSALGFFFGIIWRAITVNQQKQKQIFILYFIFAAASLLISSRRAPFQMLILIPALTYFISEIFTHLKGGILKSILSLFFFLGIPFMGYFWFKSQETSQEINKYLIIHQQKHEVTEGKKILVLGEDLAYYHKAQLATPYLNFKLSKRILEDPSDFEKMAEIYQNFVNDPPEIIIDEQGVFKNLSQRITPLKNRYKLISEHVYELSPSPARP
jgi:hypothetical protein